MIDRIIQTIDRTIAMPPYNEDTLVQQTTADFLEKELGWESIYAFDETLGSNGLLGRENRKEVILTRYLRPPSSRNLTNLWKPQTRETTSS
jgi:hypothetical protein